jgi:hypothetical protein
MHSHTDVDMTRSAIKWQLPLGVTPINPLNLGMAGRGGLQFVVIAAGSYKEDSPRGQRIDAHGPSGIDFPFDGIGPALPAGVALTARLGEAYGGRATSRINSTRRRRGRRPALSRIAQVAAFREEQMQRTVFVAVTCVCGTNA